MPLFPSPYPRAVMIALITTSGSIGLRTASAEESKLTVHTKPSVLYTGESAEVSVLAEFPTTTYALAAAQFNVGSTHPAWTFASGGNLVGDDVVNIFAGVRHRPLANPANPHLIWKGVLSPTFSEPSLVKIEAAATSFFVYPTRHSPLSIPNAAAGGNDYLMVNPLNAGQWIAAPGAGSTIAVHTTDGSGDDVVVDGRITTGNAPTTPLLVGLLLPAIQSVRESASRIGFDEVPDTFRASVQIERSGIPIESHSLNFEKIRYIDGSYDMSFGAEASSGEIYAFTGFLGGVSVATAPVNSPSPHSPPTIIIPSIPPHSNVRLAGKSEDRIQWILEFDEPVEALILDQSNQFNPHTIDSMEISAPISVQGTNVRGQNNLRQLGLAIHTFEATGIRHLRVMPAQPQ